MVLIYHTESTNSLGVKSSWTRSEDHTCEIAMSCARNIVDCVNISNTFESPPYVKPYCRFCQNARYSYPDRPPALSVTSPYFSLGKSSSRRTNRAVNILTCAQFSLSSPYRRKGHETAWCQQYRALNSRHHNQKCHPEQSGSTQRRDTKTGSLLGWCHPCG